MHLRLLWLSSNFFFSRYSGQQRRFTIERDDRGTERPPTAATCFNTLKLPPYASAETLAAKLRLTFWAEGFHEGAVAT